MTDRLPRRSSAATALGILLAATCGMMVLAGRERTAVPLGELNSANAALVRGLDWLVRQQAADGGWHSSTYGMMRGGMGNTSLTLFALSCVPREYRAQHGVAIQRACGFLVSNLDELGFVRGADGTCDYPNYATALTLLAMTRLEISSWPDERQRMYDYLVRSQQTSRQGRAESDPHYGGWDRTGGLDADKPGEVETDLAITTLALEAIDAASVRQMPEEVRDAARVYLGRCQNLGPGTTDDGGFRFSPVADDLRNKAGTVAVEGGAPIPRSYGTATADGIRGLMLLQLWEADARLRSAVGWLGQHRSEATIPGFVDTEAAAWWGAGMRYYYQASIARLMPGMSRGVRVVRRNAFFPGLTRFQHPDGSWRNEVASMREDDPLIATSFAIITLSLLNERND